MIRLANPSMQYKKSYIESFRISQDEGVRSLHTLEEAEKDFEKYWMIERHLTKLAVHYGQ